ncbi:Putative lipoprotein YteS precursor [Paenibacillus konkukensis]|uniref:Lipoprotein YteS n=2 Tax=Paenibacillus konkukensis TaxID=2020716 RepID=A0ABY4RW38_9BACL|nr:Putative lipoprotein YteS precursor [Paenibacillus konkukensis]
MRGKFMLIMLLLLVLAGCGGGPKSDVPIFMMGANGIPTEVGDKLQTALQAKLGQAPTVNVQTVPIFSMEKLIVEIAAGDNGIIVVPMEQFKAIGQQGGYVSLDDAAKGEDYPEGVLDLPVDGKESGKTEKHLYGIPLEKTKWFTEQKLNGKDLVAFVPANAKNQDKVMQVIKVIAEK